MRSLNLKDLEEVSGGALEIEDFCNEIDSNHGDTKGLIRTTTFFVVFNMFNGAFRPFYPDAVANGYDGDHNGYPDYIEYAFNCTNGWSVIVDPPPFY